MKLLHIVFFFLLPVILFSQENKNFKFGKISEKDFAQKIYPIDSNANAVIICDIGNSYFEGNPKGWFNLVFRRFKRVHILNKNGYDEATEIIHLYKNDEDEEKINIIKGATYNLVDGKIEKTMLQKSDIYTTKVDDKHSEAKFTLPNVKEGSIIEIEYEVSSDFIFSLQPWAFQGDNPVLWSEYNVALPEFFNYVSISQGATNFFINTKKSETRDFRVSVPSTFLADSKYYSFNAFVAECRWVMKDVPALKEESYTSSVQNYIAKIEFQLSEFRDPLMPKKILGNWQTLAEELMQKSEFGEGLNKNNNWMSDVIKSICSESESSLSKAKKIYDYVRDNFSLSSTKKGFLMSQSLKDVMKNKKGTAADINLLLTAMLKNVDLDASPVLISTRENGFANQFYPLVDKFNFVIASVKVDTALYFLDASDQLLCFGKLNYNCYNGYSFYVNTKSPYIINLDADKLVEKSSSIYSIYPKDSLSSNLMVKVKKHCGFYESYRIRKNTNFKNPSEYFKKLEKDLGGDIKLYDTKIDSLDKLDFPVYVEYTYDMNLENTDLIYINPMLDEAHKENPFKSAIRRYPIEFPFKTDETYVLYFAIPDNYIVDEIPKSAKAYLNDETETLFEYLIQKSEGIISLRSRVLINKIFFSPEEYEDLRNIFGLIVKKQNEKIIFKKKN